MRASSATWARFSVGDKHFVYQVTIAEDAEIMNQIVKDGHLVQLGSYGKFAMRMARRKISYETVFVYGCTGLESAKLNFRPAFANAIAQAEDLVRVTKVPVTLNEAVVIPVKYPFSREACDAVDIMLRKVLTVAEMVHGLPREVTELALAIYGTAENRSEAVTCHYDSAAGLGRGFKNWMGALMGCVLSPDKAKILLNTIVVAIAATVNRSLIGKMFMHKGGSSVGVYLRKYTRTRNARGEVLGSTVA